MTFSTTLGRSKEKFGFAMVVTGFLRPTSCDKYHPSPPDDWWMCYGVRCCSAWRKDAKVCFHAKTPNTFSIQEKQPTNQPTTHFLCSFLIRMLFTIIKTWNPPVKIQPLNWHLYKFSELALVLTARMLIKLLWDKKQSQTTVSSAHARNTLEFFWLGFGCMNRKQPLPSPGNLLSVPVAQLTRAS